MSDFGAGILPFCTATGRLLLQRRSPLLRDPLTWSTWGGLGRTGESAEEVARREFVEESGYQGELDLEHVYTSLRDGFRYETFLGSLPIEFDPCPQLQHAWEVCGWRWLSWEELQTLSCKHWGVVEVIDTVLVKRWGHSSIR